MQLTHFNSFISNFKLDSERVNGREHIVKLAQHGLALRQWERQHLPTEDSQLGYEVFLKLAELVAGGNPGQPSLLKQVYLGLPYSEKGIRLHLRRLEDSGWITVSKASADARAAQVDLSADYWELLNHYAARWTMPASEIITNGGR